MKKRINNNNNNDHLHTYLPVANFMPQNGQQLRQFHLLQKSIVQDNSLILVMMSKMISKSYKKNII